MLRRLGLSSSRGSSWLGGLFWGLFPDLSSEFEDALYGVINGHVCKQRGEHLAACRGYLARRRGGAEFAEDKEVSTPRVARRLYALPSSCVP
jgi:hypothetical protein